MNVRDITDIQTNGSTIHHKMINKYKMQFNKNIYYYSYDSETLHFDENNVDLIVSFDNLLEKDYILRFYYKYGNTLNISYKDGCNFVYN